MGGHLLAWSIDQPWVVRHGRTELARVEPDEKHDGMWRVRSPEGRLSDMANITWAKDAAATMALAVLNRSDGIGTSAGAVKTSRSSAPYQAALQPDAPPLATY
jgi:hypothetical protein